MRGKRIKSKTLVKKSWKAALSLVLALALALGAWPAAQMQLGTGGYVEAAPSGEAVADDATADNWANLNYNPAEGRTTKNDGRIWTDKSVYSGDAIVKSGDSSTITVKKDEDANFLVGLSALSSTMSVDGISTNPLDIILVLDVSGSMAEDMGYDEVYASEMVRQGTYFIKRNNNYTQLIYNTNTRAWYYRNGNNNVTVNPKTSATDNDANHTQVYVKITKMEALEKSVNAFVDYTKEANNQISDETKQHRIALVKFSGNTSNNVGNTTYYYDGNEYNHSQVVKNFVAVTDSNVADFNSSVAALSPAGATRADNGLTVATNVMNNVRDNAQPVVIFFTDGIPTSFSEWSDSVANGAITNAKKMKDAGAWVYSVGVFENSDPTGNGSLERYMNAVSSNYPKATGFSVSTMGTKASSDYFQTADDSAKLAEIFKNIATEISGKSGQVPTHVEDGYDAEKGGYITFVDRLGDYMEVTSVKSVVYEGVEYNNQIGANVWNTANSTTDVFENSSQVTNDLGDPTSIGSVVVTIERSENARTGDIITVKIPAALVPLAYYNVTVENGLATTERIPTTPIRAFYEVGLKDEARFLMAAPDADMKDYMSTHTSDGQVVFYSNAFDSVANAEDGSTVATYMPAKTNSMYFAVNDTPIFANAACTRPVTSYNPNTTYYYQREYYVVGEDLEPQYEVIEFASSILSLVTYDFSGEGGQLVVKAGNGRYTRADASDTVKATGANKTSTAVKVSTPRWENWTTGTSPVTVFLGNNGLLKVTPELFKTVSGEHIQDEGTSEELKITLGDGSAVHIGDILTYKVRAINTEDTTATLTVTDQVPAGTEYVAGSADNNGVYNATTGVITWTLKDVPAEAEREVSFQVKVTKDILNVGFTTVNNTAYVSVNNNPAYATNTTINPPTGKSVEAVNSNVDLEEGVQVGDELTFYITYANDTDKVADVRITDVVPVGTTYMAGSASHNGTYSSNDKTLVWNLKGVQPGAIGTVSFRVVVNAAAQTKIENEAKIKVGPNGPEVKTNPVEVKVKTANLVLKKTVTLPNGYTEAESRYATEFTLNLKEVTGNLSGIFELLRNGKENPETITFNEKGEASVTIKHNDVLEIQGLPAGVVISVVETAVSGYTPAYSGLSQAGTITLVNGKTNTVAVTNDYAVTPAPFQLKGTKTIDSETWIPDLTFTFTSQACDANGTVASGATTVTATAAVSNDHKTVDFAFSPRSFETPGTRYYLITEYVSGVNGVVYDTTQYLLKIVVSDDGKGALSTDMTITSRKDVNASFTAYATAEDAKVVFKNGYVPAETQLSLAANKVLANRELKDGMFSFEVKDKATGAPVTSGQNNADGSITFRPITYKPSDLGDATSKTFTYVVSEVNSGMTGVKYDTATFDVTVTLTNVNGQLKATATYPEGGITFNNEFDPGEKSVALNVTKVLSGEPRVLRGGEFSFEAKDAAGNVVASGTNDANGNVAFSEIGYTLKDLDGADEKVFIYTISEIKPDLSYDPFVEYSTLQYTAEVTVAYNNADGTLTVSAPVYKLNGSVVNKATFTNIVNKDYVEITPNALTKSTTGSNVPANARFSFSILDMNLKEVGTGVGQANGTVNFSALSFEHVGEYNFWIQETNAGKTFNGITYDGVRYLLKVNVTYDSENSELDASQAYYALKPNGNKDNAADYTATLEAPHFNNTYNANGLATVSATKVLNGRALAEGEFSFHLTRLDNEKVTNGYMKADGTIEFASLYYTNNDIPEGQTSTVIKYKMSEIVPAEANKLPGVTYTDKVYYAAVTLEIDSTDNSKIITDVKYYTDEDCTVLYEAKAVPEFVNTYAPKENTSTSIKVAKELTGRTLKNGEFSFELVHIKADGTSQVVEVATNDANGVIEFVRTYYAETWPEGLGKTDVKYLIREVKGNLGGVTYDPQVFGVKLTVVDTGTGKLAVDENSIKYYKGSDFTQEIAKAQVVFKNSYTAQGTSYTPVATKKLTGRTMTDNEFAFEVHEFDLNTGKVGALRSTGLSKSGGNVVFTPIGYSDQPGTNTATFNYVISEIAGNMGGVSYDDTKYYLAVTVKDEGQGKVEVVDAQYYTGYANNALTGKVSAITFENKYVPKDAYVTLQATKELDGRPLKDGEFDFVVKDGKGEVVTYGTNDKDGNITFGTISYTQADLGGAKSKTFEYFVSEIEPSDADRIGITVDEKEHKVTVKVTDDGNGNLTTEVVYAGGKIVFKNKYNPDSATVSFTALKTLLDKKLEAGEFYFELSGDTMDAPQVKVNDKDGLVTFDSLEFTEPGEYIYTVKELSDKTTVSDSTNPDGSINKAGSYDFDESVYTVKVQVTDDYTGQLQTTVTYYKNGVAEANKVNSITFENEYTRGELINVDLSTVIDAKKVVTSPDGIDYELNGDDFKFIVYDIRNNVISTGTNAKDGKIINFAPFAFETAGYYRYWIVEDTTDKPGITIDNRAWELHIQVHYDDITGKLFINPETDVKTFPMERAVDEEKAPVFENTYTPAPAEATITVNKNLVGRPLSSNEFIFTLYEVKTVGTGSDAVENLIPVAEARNDAEGNVKFTFNIDTVGTHQYKVVELIPEEGSVGMEYDSTAVEGIQIVVRNDQTSGKLVANAATMPNDSEFENIYTAAETSVIIEAFKLVEVKGNTNYELKGNEFTFQLLDSNNKVVAETKNGAEGVVRFNVTYTDLMMDGADEKTFTYTIKEVIPAKADRISGMTYDESGYGVTVTVKDDFAGNLHAVVNYEDVEVPTIVNKYEAESTEVVIEANKTLKGKTLRKGDFTFELVDFNGNVLAEAKNNAKGKIEFKLELVESGEYTFTLREKIGSDKDITYDTKSYTVKVKVTDNMAGQLEAEVSYENGQAPTFVNVYKTDGTQTGDDMNLIMWYMLLFISGGAIAVLGAYAKKRRNNSK